MSIYLERREYSREVKLYTMEINSQLIDDINNLIEDEYDFGAEDIKIQLTATDIKDAWNWYSDETFNSILNTPVVGFKSDKISFERPILLGSLLRDYLSDIIWDYDYEFIDGYTDEYDDDCYVV